jgi:hypothetical protein
MAGVSARVTLSDSTAFRLLLLARGPPRGEAGGFLRALRGVELSDAQFWRSAMAFTNEQHRKRYAEDPEYRERKLAENRAYRAENREELNAQWYEKWMTDADFREGRRARRLMKYGLTPADFDRMALEQKGLCAICKRKPQRWLCVDHCHATHKVRGLLCDNCNTALGLLDDNSEWMREAADYVDRGRGILVPWSGPRPAIVIPGDCDEPIHAWPFHSRRL